MRFNNNSDTKGGIAAREHKGPLWYFLPENNGAFLAPYADYVSRLYFPLMNRHGMKCSVTPELKGDIASAFQNYLTAATVTEELHRNVSGRNFWVTIPGEKPWSATGNSAFQKAEKWSSPVEVSEVEGQLGAFITRRNNTHLGLESEITVFVPDTDDFVELMKVTLTNVSDKPVTFTATSATAIFGRHPDNFRDHRQVTTMFQKVFREDHGVRVKPTIVHDEHGHSENDVSYAVLGFGESGDRPVAIWPLMYDFIGEGGSLDNPEAVFSSLRPKQLLPEEIHGHEAIGAMRYADKALAPGEKAHYIILHGITRDEGDLQQWKKSFGSAEQFDHHLEKTLKYWQEVSTAVSFETADTNFDNWTKWVTFQLKCRQIFGNSYLPDFGYGRGGRGWRDLWQDLLSIFLVDPVSAREEILNNFKGIRVDGSNATIIGTRPGEFIADRNNVPRTWCDHGAWPVFVLNFYLHQTGDYAILKESMTYWKDQFGFRSRQIDKEWNASQGNLQKDGRGEVYLGSVLEHVLTQQLSAFFNVGDHNNILLEGGDWNDTLDMARENGESVCFHNFYAYNLEIIAGMLEHLQSSGYEKIDLFEELALLLDRMPGGNPVDYASPAAKRDRLKQYFKSVMHTVSGSRKSWPISDLINDLRTKSIHMAEHIRSNEWLKTKEGHEYFNGHYSNLGEPLHGDHPLGIRMDLTSQVMPVMCNVAGTDQIGAIWKSANVILKDRDSDGLRLCTDFKELDLNIGRVTGFVYGNKEHGSKWMQQNIMLAYGLYKRGFVREGHDILQQVYRLAIQSDTSRIFPGVPSYFNNENHGAYAYLTGSSSWLLLTLKTQVFGVRGEHGDLVLQPALVKEQFDKAGNASVSFHFAGRKLKVVYANPELLDFEKYMIHKVYMNGEIYKPEHRNHNHLVIPRPSIERMALDKTVTIEVLLGKIIG